MGGTEQATFGMGCFWAPQKRFDALRGVLSTQVGYTGGTNLLPSYTSVCQGDGHIEAVRIEYDTDVITYEDLLDEFYSQDKSSLLSQKGQYRSSIFYHSGEQKAAAIARGDNEGLTIFREKAPFFVAEDYHQKYEQKQFPRLAVLGTGFIIDVIPNMNPVVYKLGAALTFGYIGVFLLERILQPLSAGKLRQI
jgi:peptide-methionine (S)-S-oxide reductase